VIAAAEKLAQQSKTSPKRKGALALSLSSLADVPAADGDDGHQFDEGNGGYDYNGGFEGTVANLENCLYLMTGSVKDEDVRIRTKISHPR